MGARQLFNEVEPGGGTHDKHGGGQGIRQLRAGAHYADALHTRHRLSRRWIYRMRISLAFKFKESFIVARRSNGGIDKRKSQDRPAGIFRIGDPYAPWFSIFPGSPHGKIATCIDHASLYFPGDHHLPNTIGRVALSYCAEANVHTGVA